MRGMGVANYHPESALDRLRHRLKVCAITMNVTLAAANLRLELLLLGLAAH